MSEKPTMNKEEIDAIVELTKKHLLGGDGNPPNEDAFLNSVYQRTSGRYGEPDGKQTMGKEEVGDIVDLTSGELLNEVEFLDRVYQATSGRDGKQLCNHSPQSKSDRHRSSFKDIVRGCSKGFLRGLYTPFFIKTGLGKTNKDEDIALKGKMTENEYFSTALSQIITSASLVSTTLVGLYNEKPEYLGAGAALLAVTNGIDYLRNKAKNTNKLQ